MPTQQKLGSYPSDNPQYQTPPSASQSTTVIDPSTGQWMDFSEMEELRKQQFRARELANEMSRLQVEQAKVKILKEQGEVEEAQIKRSMLARALSGPESPVEATITGPPDPTMPEGVRTIRAPQQGGGGLPPGITTAGLFRKMFGFPEEAPAAAREDAMAMEIKKEEAREKLQTEKLASAQQHAKEVLEIQHRQQAGAQKRTAIQSINKEFGGRIDKLTSNVRAAKRNVDLKLKEEVAMMPEQKEALRQQLYNEIDAEHIDFYNDIIRGGEREAKDLGLNITFPSFKEQKAISEPPQLTPEIKKRWKSLSKAKQQEVKADWKKRYPGVPFFIEEK